jgi:hypothetical protein
LIPLIVGTLLALAALSFVLYPLLAARPAESDLDVPAPAVPANPAIDALREIEFDRATGKLSDADYSALKASYTRAAVESMRSGDALVCPTCGPRPERDAVFCSRCGALLA